MTDWIKAIFGSGVLVSAGPIGTMTPEAIIAKYREMMPNETRWATDEMLMKRAWGLANWFNSLGEGVYKTSDGQPTDAWWNLIAKLANPGSNLWIPSRPLGSIEEELDPEEASAITPVGRHYWELVRQHPEDPLYWKLADPARFDYFIMYYEDRRPGEEPFDPARYQQDLTRRIVKDFPPRQDVAASSIWGEIGFGEVLRKADKMGRRSEFIQYAEQFWTKGQGFSRNPSEIFEEWAGQHGVGFDWGRTHKAAEPNMPEEYGKGFGPKPSRAPSWQDISMYMKAQDPAWPRVIYNAEWWVSNKDMLPWAHELVKKFQARLMVYYPDAMAGHIFAEDVYGWIPEQWRAPIMTEILGVIRNPDDPRFWDMVGDWGDATWHLTERYVNAHPELKAIFSER